MDYQMECNSNVADEYLGDIKLEELFRLLTNYNRNFNSMPAILSQFKGVPCMVTAEFEHDLPASPVDALAAAMKHIDNPRSMPDNQHFLRLVIEPCIEEEVEKLFN
jgi:hypothetical protein